MAGAPLARYFADERRTYRFRFAVYVAFFLLCLVGGGGSRGDILSLLYVRPAAALCLGMILLTPAPIDFRAIRLPLLLIAGLSLWLVIQLIPLPPSIWTQLPGREPIAAGAEILGVAQPWRPISMSPDLTLNSLAAIIVPLSALIGFAGLDEDGRRQLLPILIGAALASAVLGIAQLSGGSASPFYLYRVTNEDAAVGFFANRNHEAALLALAFAMLGVWAAMGEDRLVRRRRAVAATITGVFLVPMILVTGSRAGLALAAVAAVWGCLLYAREIRDGSGARLGKALAVAASAVVTMGGLFVFLASGRAVALQRLLGADQNELRLKNLPVLADMAKDLFPWGSGFGTFDPVYRIYERHEALSPRYLNQAHNDLLELLITGGLPALLLLIVFLAWWARCGWKLLRRSGQPSRRLALGRLGFVMIFLLLGASLVDYPLRVPLMAFVFAIACGWLGSARKDLCAD